MTSTPAVLETKERGPERHMAERDGISVTLGVLWIVGVAAAWNVVLVRFHDRVARLLS